MAALPQRFAEETPGSMEATIVDAMHAPSLGNTFVLGSFASRVTFADQQWRALNLIWALWERGLLYSGDRLAIIGGGLAGVTAAAAARVIGVKEVTLLEAHHQLLPLPRGNNTRYIHPNIYDWPKPHSLLETTEFPLLNWRAGYANDVVSQIDEEWKQYCHRIRVLPGYQVTEIWPHPSNSRKVWVAAEGKDRLDQGFECVILATGFGLERTVRGIPSRSYWQNDDLHQIKLDRRGTVVRVLVSGCGDGGLVDLFRLTIKDFRHATLLKELRDWGPDELSAVAASISEIEREAARLPAADARSYIQEQYESFPIPAGLVREMRKRARSDTRVTINNRTGSPFDPRASPLNRFILALLLRARKVRFRADGLHVESNSQGYHVRFGDDRRRHQFDDVIVRHGPDGGDLVKWLSKADAKRLKQRQSAYPDPTRVPQWPDDFFQVPSGRPKRRAEAARSRVKLVRVAALLNGSGTYPQEALESFRTSAERLLGACGFKLVLRPEIGYPEVGADERNREVLRSLLTRFGAGEDYVLTIGSGVTAFYARQPDRRPHIFTSVTNAISIGVVQPGEESRRNRDVCGASFLDALEERLRFVRDLFPDKKGRPVRAGFIFSPKFPVDNLYLARLQAAATKVRERVVVVPIQVNAPAELRGRDDDLDICLGWLFVNLHIGEILLNLTKPLLGSAFDDVRNECVAAIGPDDTEMGELAADILHKAVCGGKRLREIQLPIPRRIRISVNRPAALRNNMPIPAAILRRADNIVD